MFAPFVQAHRDLGFRIYPECCGHDLIMVAPDVLPERRPGAPAWARSGDFGALQPGDIIAVEGKLRASVEVLRQAMPPEFGHRRHAQLWPMTPKPTRFANWYVVLIPSATTDFREIAFAVGITVVTSEPEGAERRYDDSRPIYMEALRHRPEVPLELPSVCVELTPGHPAPRRVTDWKLRAVQLCMLGLERDLTAADVGSLARNFINNGWLTRTGMGKTAVYRLVDVASRPDVAYPEIVAALRKQASPDAPAGDT